MILKGYLAWRIMMKFRKRNKWGIFSIMAKSAMFICLVLLGLQVGDLYVDFKHTNPDLEWYQFFTHKEYAEWNTYEQPPAAFVEKVGKFNNITRTVWFAIFFFVFFEICKYKEDKDSHWFDIYKKKLNKRFPKIKESLDKIEDDI